VFCKNTLYDLAYLQPRGVHPASQAPGKKSGLNYFLMTVRINTARC